MPTGGSLIQGGKVTKCEMFSQLLNVAFKGPDSPNHSIKEFLYCYFKTLKI